MSDQDREKLARETWRAFHAYTRGPDPDIEGDRVLFYTLADIAIAYADRRVAEAVEEAANVCFERKAKHISERMNFPEQGADRNELTMLAIEAGWCGLDIRALSPAREGGGHE